MDIINGLRNKFKSVKESFNNTFNQISNQFIKRALPSKDIEKLDEESFKEEARKRGYHKLEDIKKTIEDPSQDPQLAKQLEEIRLLRRTIDTQEDRVRTSRPKFQSEYVTDEYTKRTFYDEYDTVPVYDSRPVQYYSTLTFEYVVPGSKYPIIEVKRTGYYNNINQLKNEEMQIVNETTQVSDKNVFIGGERIEVVDNNEELYESIPPSEYGF